MSDHITETQYMNTSELIMNLCGALKTPIRSEPGKRQEEPNFPFWFIY